MKTKADSLSPKPLDIAVAGETNLDLVLYGLPEDMGCGSLRRNGKMQLAGRIL